MRKKDKKDALASPTKSFIKHSGTVTRSVAIPITKSRLTHIEFNDNENNLIKTFGNVSPTIIL